MAFCKGASAKIKNFIGNISKQVLQYTEISLRVTEAIKNFLSSPVADIITAIIPGDLDNVLKAQLESAIDYVIAFLITAKDCNAEGLPLEQKLICIVEHVKNQPPAAQEALLSKMASLITRHLDNQEQKQHIYDSIVQLQYSLKK